MQLPELCIRRPVMTTLLMAAFLIFGIIAYRALPVSELPSVDFPTISVTASPARRLAGDHGRLGGDAAGGQFSTISGLDNMTSTSARGTSTITLQFGLDRDIDAAAQDVQSAIAAAQRKLPPDMPTPPSFRKVNPADFRSSIGHELADPAPGSVNEYAETQLAQRMSTMPGVAQVLIYGAQKYAVRIQADPTSSLARGIGIDELHAAVKSSNVNQPTGNLEGDKQSFALRPTASCSTPTPTGPDRGLAQRRAGALEEVARVVDASRDNQGPTGLVQGPAHHHPGHPAPAGANTIATVSAIKAILPPSRPTCRPRSTCGVLRPQRHRSASRSTTCSSPWSWPASW
jgi:HAE1 family hydrophobic/amphiphilic exporter-1